MEDNEPTFLEHLEVFRWVLITSIIPIFIFFCVGYYFAEEMINYLIGYGKSYGFSLNYFSLLEPFLAYLKVSFGVAFIVALPLTLMNLWRFVSPAIYSHSKRFVFLMISSAYILFILGGLFIFSVILPFFIRFSLGFQTPQLQAIIGVGDFVSLVLMLVLGMGLVFEIPLIIIGLIKFNILTTQQIAKQRPTIIIVILILAAIITPPDPFSQLLTAIPCYLLFEVSLLIAKGLSRSKIKSRVLDKSS